MDTLLLKPSVCKGRALILRDLWHQYNLYHMTLCLLLQELTTATELHDMTNNPKSALWTSGDMRQKIRTKLGVAYMAHLSTIEGIEDIIMMLSRHLDIDRASRVLTF